MKYKRDLATPLAVSINPGETPKKPRKKKKIKTQNLKQVNVPAVGRYTDEKQPISKAKKKAKNFSRNENTGYASKVTPKKVKTITYKDGKKVKTTVAKDGKFVTRGKEAREKYRADKKEVRKNRRKVNKANRKQRNKN
tara:strand:+ start:20648 stop:21061 length:414 start_codon:yes stop_codon:yes gene_type:complete